MLMFSPFFCVRCWIYGFIFFSCVCVCHGKEKPSHSIISSTSFRTPCSAHNHMCDGGGQTTKRLLEKPNGNSMQILHTKNHLLSKIFALFWYACPRHTCSKWDKEIKRNPHWNGNIQIANLFSNWLNIMLKYWAITITWACRFIILSTPPSEFSWLFTHRNTQRQQIYS